MSDEYNYPNGDEPLENPPPIPNSDSTENYAQENASEQASSPESPTYYTQQTHYNYQQPQTDYQVDEPNGMATAALVLGIISAAFSCCCCAAIPLAGLSIILALLSKGGATRMSGRAKTGLWIAIAGLAVTVLLTGAVFVTNRSIFTSDEFMNPFREYMQDYEGNSNYNSEEVEQLFEDFF